MTPSRAREQSEKYHVNKSSRTCGILVLMVSIADFQSAGDGSSPLYPSIGVALRSLLNEIMCSYTSPNYNYLYGNVAQWERKKLLISRLSVQIRSFPPVTGSLIGKALDCGSSRCGFKSRPATHFFKENI